MFVKTLGSKIGKIKNYISEESVYWIAPALIGLIILCMGIIFVFTGYLIARDSGRLATAEERKAYNNIISYVKDKDIESVEYLREENKYSYKTAGVVIKVTGKEPKTFNFKYIYKGNSHDDKIHIGGENYNIIIYEPIDYTANYISN